MTVNNGSVPTGWQIVFESSDTLFGHETPLAASVIDIINNGIKADEKQLGKCSMGRGLYANKYLRESLEDDVNFMVVFKPSRDLKGFEVYHDDYSYGNGVDSEEKKLANQRYEHFFDDYDFYTYKNDRIEEYVFHPQVKIEIVEIFEIVNKRLGKKYTKDEFLSTFS